MAVPLSVLDLVPVASGSSAADALDRSVDLARRAEALGYRRYWLAEHHLNPGVAGTSPAVVIALLGAATDHIRIGSGGVQMGHRTPLSVVEEFGLLDAAFPGRIDLGLGRSGGRTFSPNRPGSPQGGTASVAKQAAGGTRVVKGLRIPPRFSPSRLMQSPRFKVQAGLLQQPGAQTPPYDDQIDELLALLRSGYRSPEGPVLHAVPGEGAEVEVWILGSSAGESARTAGHRGLRFAANYHVSPATVLEAVDEYRSTFRSSRELDRPYVCVSADVVVADDDRTAQRLATGYGLWVRSIRSAEGAIAYPTPEEAAAHRWTDDDRALVADRVETQFVGSPATVVEQLRCLQAATGADELVVTTMTHEHADRVRSYELLAEAWPIVATDTAGQRRNGNGRSTDPTTPANDPPAPRKEHAS